MARNSSKETTQRQLRVGEELRHVLAEVLARGELHDPVMQGVSVTVSEVRVGPDLRRATAFIMPLGGQDVSDITAALNRAAPFIRGRVSRMINLRYTPSFIFETDTAFDEAGKIDALLRQGKAMGHGEDGGA